MQFLYLCSLMVMALPTSFSFHVFRNCHHKSLILGAGFGQSKEAITKSRAPSPEVPCACGSGNSYGNCCKPYHDGTANPADPVLAVRSRFSALAYNIIPYIISTTHPKHKEYVLENEQKSKRKIWEKDLYAYATEYEFITLIFNDEEKDKQTESDIGLVSFTAKLRKAGSERPPEDVKELSKFKKEDGKWLYLDADVKNPFKNIKGDYVTPQRRAVSTVKKGVPLGN
eukprot:gene9177-19012_t